MREDLERIDNVIERYLSIFGNRWNLLILYELFNGAKRFNELKRSLEPISQTVLTRHLKSLEASGIIDREVYPGTPVSVFYAISETGFTVVPSMISTYGWIVGNLRD